MHREVGPITGYTDNALANLLALGLCQKHQAQCLQARGDIGTLLPAVPERPLCGAHFVARSQHWTRGQSAGQRTQGWCTSARAEGSAAPTQANKQVDQIRGYNAHVCSLALGLCRQQHAQRQEMEGQGCDVGPSAGQRPRMMMGQRERASCQG